MTEENKSKIEAILNGLSSTQLELLIENLESKIKEKENIVLPTTKSPDIFKKNTFIDDGTLAEEFIEESKKTKQTDKRYRKEYQLVSIVCDVCGKHEMVDPIYGRQKNLEKETRVFCSKHRR